ncbi:MAG: 30S ribosomal protein S16 [Planctomycetota bacterium]
MAVRLRLKRMGRRNRSFFRISAMDSRAPRDGRTLEELGFYDPVNRDARNQLQIDEERVRYWLRQGAIPSETVRSLLARQGIATR